MSLVMNYINTLSYHKHRRMSTFDKQWTNDLMNSLVKKSYSKETEKQLKDQLIRVGFFD